MAAEETIKATMTQEVAPDTTAEPAPEEAPAKDAAAEPAPEAAAEPAPEEVSAEPAPEAAAEPAPEEAPADAAPAKPAAEAPTESMDDMGEDLEDSYKLMGDGVHDTDTLIAWSKIMELYEAGTDIETEVAGIVNKGVIVMIEGIRGFVPASRLSLKRVYDLNDWLGRKIKVRIITADPDNDKLVLSAREILQEERDNAKKEKISAVKVGEVFTGKVDSIQDYGVFVNLGNGLSGLVHISQISLKHIKHPSEELKVGDEVRVKVIGKQNGKLKLSMKALLEQKKKEDESRVEMPKAESVGTSLGDLLKDVKL
ncbi:MAG: S1 RNA-binding domain-containing protein [Lachnospiraceae bacterium]|nr:S1 RNA-binding domain-containing protein [Lachnospiraceae bacterium]